MDISATLNTPATPPYDYQNHTTTYNKMDLFFDRQPSSPDSNQQSSAFRRVSSMPSPPELLLDTASSDEEDNASYTSYLHTMPNRKSVPHRSPSNVVDHNSIVFQIEKNCTPKILGGGNTGILWSLRQRVSLARKQHNKNRLSAPRPSRVRPMRIQIPRPQWSPTTSFEQDDLVSPSSPILSSPKLQPAVAQDQQPSSWQPTTTTTTTTSTITKTVKQTVERKKPTSTPRKNSSHASSGRPSRVKGPCQACHETSDGCMRKAFNWPFPTSTIFNDKGKPFVYLCNKCGLRYNKSGGCVCRHCRWVLCKEEKRKAMQYIDQMRRYRRDGHVDMDEDIENFACSPKYWSCGRPWKVGWVLNSQHDDEDEEDPMHHSPSLSEATL